MASTPLLTFINPPALYDPTANGYTHVAVVAPGARVVHIAGQGGETADGVLPATFPAQLRQAMDNLHAALEAAGAAPRDVAKLTVLVVDHDERKLQALGAEMDRLWGGAARPACTLIPVPRLALDGMLFEVDAVAVLPE